MTQTTLYWLLWGIGLLIWGVVGFAVKEIIEYLKNEGGTLTEVHERANRRYFVVKWGSVGGFTILSVGFGLAGIHIHTGLF
jgi:hypothetical protein